MSVPMKEDQFLSRLVKVYGIERPVVVTITRNGLTMKVKGSRTPVEASWLAVVNACTTPSNVPSKLHGRCLEFMQDSDRKLGATLLKRLNKEAEEKTQ